MYDPDTYDKKLHYTSLDSRVAVILPVGNTVREGGREGRKEGGREGRKEGGKEGRKEGGREGGREGSREGGREREKERV